MPQVIKGTYENGLLTLDKEPDVKKKSDVLVTFLTEETKSILNQRKAPGSLRGRVDIPDDFNKPLDDLREYM